jgi:hypothetical protein
MIQIFEYLLAGIVFIVFAILTYGGYLLEKDKQDEWEKRNDDKL